MGQSSCSRVAVESELPSDNPSGGEPPRGPDGPDTPPTPPAKKPLRVRRQWKTIACGIAVPAVLVALVGGLLYGVVVTASGTAYASGRRPRSC